tara:strand:+ start:74 stop:631 length:558 start_codon:yes stop_codon:yes gene_type:complete
MIDKELSRNIKKRRSIFPNQFNGQLIDKETILELLKNANTAPTHKLTQPWFFKIFSKDGKKKLAHELIKNHTKKSDLFSKKINSNFELSSHIICICMRRDTTKSIPEWEEIAATAMAIQNIWISCVNSQIGGYWSTPNGVEKLNVFLNLKKHEKCLGLFYLGIFDSIKSRKIPRKDITKDTEWIG